MSSKVVSFKPTAQFDDTCGRPLDSSPSTQHFVASVCRVLGVAQTAIQTQSQLSAALASIIPSDPSDSDLEGVLNTCMELEKAAAEAAIIKYEGGADLASLSIISTAKEVLAGKRPSPERRNQLLRLVLHAKQASV